MRHLYVENRLLLLLSSGWIPKYYMVYDSWTLQKRHNEREDVSNRRRFDCLLNLLIRRRSQKTSKLRVTGLCEENSPMTGGFHSQRASYAENVSIWWRHHEEISYYAYFVSEIVSPVKLTLVPVETPVGGIFNGGPWKRCWDARLS